MPYDNINIVKLDGIGDAIIFLCAARDAGINLDDPSVTWYTTQETQALLSEILPNTNIIAIEKNNYHVLKLALSNMFTRKTGTTLTLLALKSDIIGHYNKRIAFVVGGHCFRIGGFIHKNPFKRILNATGRCILGRTIWANDESEYNSYKIFLNKVNLSCRTGHLNFNNHLQRQVRNDISTARTDILLCPGASSVSKRYPIDGYHQLYSDLLKHYNRIKFVIGPAEIDTAQYLIEHGVPTKDIYIKPQPKELVTLIQNTKLVISNDSMIAHLSNALGTTLLCLAWGVRYNRFIKYLEISNTVLSFPCDYNNCIECAFHDQHRYKCIKKISQTQIFNQAIRLLNG